LSRNEEIIGLIGRSRYGNFVLVFDFTLVEIGIDLDDDVLPGNKSGRALNDTNKVILDSWFETLHELVDLHLFGHVEVRGKLEEMGEIVESRTSLVEMIQLLVSSESEMRIGELLLELSDKELPVLENGRREGLKVGY
jgi:hypothetical protein